MGPCCEFCLYELIPESECIACPSLERALLRCASVQAVALAMAIHLAECPVCQERQKEVNASDPLVIWPTPTARKAENGETEWVWNPRKEAA